MSETITVRLIGAPEVVAAWEAGRVERDVAAVVANEAARAVVSSVKRTRQRSAPEVDKAVEFVREVLSAGEVLSADLEQRAKEAGIASKTLQRARKRLGVKSRKVGRFGVAVWYTRLPT